MPIIVNNQQSPDHLSLNPDSILPHRPQPNTMPYDIQRLDTRTLRDQAGAKFDGALHDAGAEIQVDLTLPVPYLEAASQYGTTASSTVHDIRRFVAAVVGTGC